ncbi:MAG: GNAT family acetyltransferase [Blastopirellula sp.]|nr:MAG: GNAT family acetyltransferase [Blastopirellula sp.]
MSELQIRAFQEEDQAAVIQLWRDCQLVRSNNDPVKDIQRKLKVQRELFLVGEINNTIVASVMAGYDGHRGAVNYLAVHPTKQQLGFGKELMSVVEHLLDELGCPKINLHVRTSNSEVIKFYESLDYQIDDVYCIGKRLEYDE